MNDPWQEVSAACFPAAGLAALAHIRCHNALRVLLLDELAWINWPSGDEQLLRALRPLPKIEFFIERGSQWFALGRRMPTDRVPSMQAAKPLDRVLFPEPADIRTSDSESAQAVVPLRLTIVLGGHAQEATALRCAITDLADWADTATSAQLAAVSVAQQGESAILMGQRLPYIARSERFHGERVLIPLGYRAEPDWPDDWLCAACGVVDEHLILIDQDGVEVISRWAFAAATRAGVRLAIGR